MTYYYVHQERNLEIMTILKILDFFLMMGTNYCIFFLSRSFKTNIISTLYKNMFIFDS